MAKKPLSAQNKVELKIKGLYYIIKINIFRPTSSHKIYMYALVFNVFLVIFQQSLINIACTCA